MTLMEVPRSGRFNYIREIRVIRGLNSCLCHNGGISRQR